MKIKDRLSTYYTLLTAFILLMVLAAIYVTFLSFLKADFFTRLKDRTMVTAKLYLEADEISRDSLATIRDKYLQKIPGEIIRIYNANNTAVFIGDTQQYWHSKVINKVRSAGQLQFSDDKRQVVGIYYKDNQGDFVIIASAEDAGTNFRIAKLLKIMIAFFVIICFSLWFTGRWFAKKMLSPIDGLIKEVKKIKSSSLHYRLNEGNRKDEIGLLAHHFNTLLAHLENAFELQKTFVANASHELRTPITSIIMGAEVTLSKDRPATELKEALFSVKEDAERLDQIINVLLDLAQADMEFASKEMHPIDLHLLLDNIKEDWNKKLYPDALEIENKGNLNGFVEGNIALITIAINNVIANAFKFSNQQKVKCILGFNEQFISLSIIDTGLGINEKDINNLFKPFYRSSATGHLPGNGLGLYMTKKIMSLHRGDIRIIAQTTQTEVVLLFPKF